MEKWIKSKEAINGREVTVKWLNKNNTGNFNHNVPRIDRVFPCSWCGDYFEVDSPWKVKKIKEREDQRVFCSNECRREWFAKDWSQSNEWKEESRIRAVQILDDGLIEKINSEPQVIINSLLNQKGINFENEYNCKYFAVDNYLTECNLMIEVMGTYWHCDHRFYDKIRYQNQFDRTVRDKSKKTYIENQYGIKILYLWEEDILNNINVINKLIDEYIETNGVLDNYHSFNFCVEENNLRINNDIKLPYFELDIEERRMYIDLAEKGKSRKQQDKWTIYNCEVCGKEAEQLTTHYNQSKNHYCSQECKKNVGRSRYNCDNCGSLMIIPKYRVDEVRSGKRKSLCCSKECSISYRRKNFSKENSPLYSRVEKSCLCCSKKYTVPKGISDTSKYCSVDCQVKYNQFVHNCDNCGKEIIIPRNKKEKLISGEQKSCCCSRKCAIEFKKNNKKSD